MFSNIGPLAFKKLQFISAKVKDLHLDTFTVVNAVV